MAKQPHAFHVCLQGARTSTAVASAPLHRTARHEPFLWSSEDFIALAPRHYAELYKDGVLVGLSEPGHPDSAALARGLWSAAGGGRSAVIRPLADRPVRVREDRGHIRALKPHSGHPASSRQDAVLVLPPPEKGD